MRRFLVSMCFVVLAGCSPKLNVESSFTVDTNADASKFITIEKAKAAQKVNFNVTSNAPVSAYVFLEKNRKAVEAEVMAKKTGKLLAHEENADNITLTADIPAH